MNELEKVIIKRQEVVDRLNCSGVFSALKTLEESPALRALRQYERTIASLYEDRALRILREEAERTQRLLAPLNSYTTAFGNLTSVMESYRGINELTCVSRQVAELIEPWSMSAKALQSITPAMESLAKLSSLTNRVFEEPSLLTHLHEVLESQIDTSLWDYYDSINEVGENFDEETVEEISEIIQSPDIIERIKIFLREKGELGKQAIVAIVVWITLEFLSGLLSYCSEPIYRVIATTFLRQEESIEATELTEISRNTEIHVWNEVTNNFVEITYQLNGTEYQGYITKEELENNAELVSGEVIYEQISFMNDMVEILAEKWDADPESVYEFLNNETDLVNTYILKCYDALKHLDETELVRILEEYCKSNEIEIPFAHNNAVEENK